MEFSLTAIAQVQQKYTGVDFPLLVAAFAQMGIVRVITNIHSGQTHYEHHDGTRLSASSFKSQTVVATQASEVELQASLTKHQSGGSDFPTFCEEVAAAGIAYWIIDIAALTCGYYSLADNLILVEPVPQATLQE